jgi:hypothetical protein
MSGAAKAKAPTSVSRLPRRPRGRPTAEINERYRLDVAAFCAELREIES